MLSRKQQVLLQTLTKLLRKNAHRRLVYIAEKVHAVDLAIVFRFLNDDQQAILFGLLPSGEQKAELLENLDDSIAEDLLDDMQPEQIAELVDYMSPDEATDLIQLLDKTKAGKVLATFEKVDRDELRTLISYDEETAGGLMTTDYLSVSSSATAREVLDMIQGAGDEAETVFYIYAVDEDGRLEGVTSLREIVQSDDSAELHSFMETDIHKVRTETDQEEVAKVIEAYDILAVPVVNAENVMEGIVTVDDVIDVIREENTEDLLRMVGADQELLEDYSLKRNITSRLPWLIVTWFGGILIMKLIGTYEEQLSRFVVLTAFFPVILGMSGNLGQQSATIIVRGLAIGRVDVSRLAGTVAKEAMTGVVIGATYGILLGLAALLTYTGSEDLKYTIPLVVALGQASGMAVAAMLGAAVPMVLNRFNIDPAVATGPLVTTSLDLICMLIYMQIASLLVFS